MLSFSVSSVHQLFLILQLYYLYNIPEKFLLNHEKLHSWLFDRLNLHFLAQNVFFLPKGTNAAWASKSYLVDINLNYTDLTVP